MFMTRLKIGAALMVLLLVAGFGTAELFVQMQAAENSPKRERGNIQIAQFGGGGVGGMAPVASPGNDNDVVNIEPGESIVIPHQEIIIAVPKDHKSIVGYSNRLASFRKQEIKPPTDKAIHVAIGRNVAIVHAGDKLWGFEAGTGTWHSTDLPPGSETSIDAAENRAHACVGGKFYVFCAGGPTGSKWDIVDLGTADFSYEKWTDPSNAAPGGMGGGGGTF